MVQVQENTKVKPPSTDHDDLVHYFCRCGALEKPMRARCGKTKLVWNDVDWDPDPMEECIVCEEYKSRPCDVCGE